MAGFFYKDDSEPSQSAPSKHVNLHPQSRSSLTSSNLQSNSNIKRPSNDPLPAPSKKKTRGTPPVQPPSDSNRDEYLENRFDSPDQDELDYLDQLHEIEHNRHSSTTTPTYQHDPPMNVENDKVKSKSNLNPLAEVIKPQRPSNTNTSGPSTLTPSTRLSRPPTKFASRLVEPPLQEIDLETLYSKRHACISRIVVIQQRMISIHISGECDSDEDYGCLEHTKSYLDDKLAEYNAEVENRKLNGSTLESSRSNVPTSAPKSFGTPINRAILTSPSASSRFSAEHPALATRQPSSDDQINKPGQPLASETCTNHPLPRTHHSNNLIESVSFCKSPLLAPSISYQSDHPPYTHEATGKTQYVQEQSQSMQQSQQPSAHDLIEPNLLDDIFSDNELDINEAEMTNIRQNKNQEIEKLDNSTRFNSPPDLSGSIDIIHPNQSNLATNELSDLTPSVAKPPEEDYSKKMQHPWSRDVGKALMKIFKLSSWRHNQIDAINTTLSGKDCFVLMPTGGGKSLCYQLPAVVRSGVTKGVTIVISPLISLITDQVQALCEKEIGAAAFTGSMSPTERDYVINDLKSADPALCLIYVTPEMIMKSGLFSHIITDLQRRQLLARFVFDEAHCVSQWGHDFRPDYKDVGPKLRKEFRSVPFIALTATANLRVQKDVMSNLGITGCRVLTQSFNRANLRYEVRPKTKDVLNDIMRIITVDHQGESGIIYCLSKKACEEVACHLHIKHRIKAHHYHAGMSKDDRQNIQNAWQTGKLQVICATIAFGMGIDKPDVRFVVHHSMPSSLEGYYQETGRAGRDGRLSECILFYSYKDYTAFMRMVEQNPQATRELIERQQLNAKHVVGFCLNKLDCRRSLILSYFGEKFPSSECKRTCDTCMNPERIVMRDVSPLVKSVIKLVRQITSNQSYPVTLVHVVDVFRGSKTKKITSAGHDQIDGAGDGSSLDRTDAERLLHLMVSKDILNERFETNGMGFVNAYVQLSPAHWTFLTGKEPVMMAFNVGASSSRRNLDLEPPRAVVVRDRRSTGVSKYPPNCDDDDFIVDDDDIQENFASKPATRQLRGGNGPPIRGNVKQQALECLKAKRQLNNLQHNSSDERALNHPEGCYKALLTFKTAVINDTNYEDSQMDFPEDDVLQTLACMCPRAKEELSKIEGISKRFIDQHATSILKILRQFSNNNSVPQNSNWNNHNENQSNNRVTANSATNLHKHLSKYAAPGNEGLKNNLHSTRKSNTHNQRSAPATSKTAIKPMPIPR